MSTWLGILGLVVAPTILVTGICYLVGSAFAQHYFSFFGIDSGALGFTTTDYVMSTINVIMLPVFLLLSGFGSVLTADAYAQRLAKTGRLTRAIHAAGPSPRQSVGRA